MTIGGLILHFPSAVFKIEGPQIISFSEHTGYATKEHYVVSLIQNHMAPSLLIFLVNYTYGPDSGLFQLIGFHFKLVKSNAHISLNI